MKISFSANLFTLAIAFASVPVFAAEEKYEEFARQYMPESQAIFERFRKENNDTKALRKELMNDLQKMNREFDDDACYTAIRTKIFFLDTREKQWSQIVKTSFEAHLGELVTAEQLAENDAKLSKEQIAWEKDQLKPFVQKYVDTWGVPAMVEIPDKKYSIGKYEVTQAEYQAVIGNNPSYTKEKILDSINNQRQRNRQNTNLPVEQPDILTALAPIENVSWEDAMLFCKILTLRELANGRLPAGYEYTLPTVEQWEYACYAGLKTNYSDEELNRIAWYNRNSDGNPHLVGFKEANKFGLYDMLGNVEEWCLDSPDSRRGGNDYRMIRGGSFNDSNSRYFSGDSAPFKRKNYNRGFRVALVPVKEGASILDFQVTEQPNQNSRSKKR